MTTIGSTIIDGGTFTGNSDIAEMDGSYNTVSPGNGITTVHGGTYDNDPSTYVADGYAATKVGDVWKVGKVTAGELTKQEGATDKAATYSVPVKVVDAKGNELATYAAHDVAVSVATNDVAGTTLSSVNLDDVVANAVSSAGADAQHWDVAAILDQIKNENYRLVLQKHVMEGLSFDELEKITGIKKANLYNIKRRALNALEKIARIARTQGDVLCAVRCEEYILHCFGIHKTMQELRDLAQNAGWLTENGAYIHDLGNTAEALGLQVERKEEGTLQDVVQALDEGKQVMAAVDGGELIGDPVEERLEDVLVGGIVDHCVVVLSADIPTDEVILFDPAFGEIPLTVTIAHFLDAWNDSNNYMVSCGE